MAAVLLRPILRDACWRKLLQDEVVLYGTPSDPRGEERGKAARLRTMLHIAGRTMRPVSGKLDRPGIPDRVGDGRRQQGPLQGRLLFLRIDLVRYSFFKSSRPRATSNKEIS